MSYKIYHGAVDITSRCNVTETGSTVDFKINGQPLEAGEYLIIYQAPTNKRAENVLARLLRWLSAQVGRLLSSAFSEIKTSHS
jgi:hypothetical protein